MATYYVDENGNITKKKKKQDTTYSVDAGGNITVNKQEDIAPVKDTEKDERKWFEKGAFEDGWQFGDGFKTIWGASMDLSENVTAGVLGIGEAVVDAGAYLAGGAAKLFGGDEFADKTKDFIAKDLYDEREVARKILKVQQPFSYAFADPDEDSVFGDKTDALAQSAGQLAGVAALQSVGVPWWVTTGTTSFGSEAENAFNQGATYAQAGGSALISAGAEILTEKLSGGIKFGGKTWDDVLLQPLVNKISSKVGRTLVNLGLDAVGEGAEEVISSVFSRLGTALYKEESIEELLTSEEAMDEYLESFIGGFALGGGMGSFNAANAIASGTDYKTGLTESEQKVVDREIENRIAEQEKEGRKLTGKEKTAIAEAVKADMERGYLSTDTIESVLGGDYYQMQQTYTQEADTLQAEIEQIEARLEGDVDAAEQQRLRERLKQARAELKEHTTRMGDFKTNTSQYVTDALMTERGGKGSMLVESYNERARRGQAFEADMDKYTTKEQAVIQKAIDSGILNNTNRTHDFVDMIAKISAEKGVLFDFTNNQKLKESGFAVEGKAVNGYVTKDGVTVNIDSAKSLNSVVGHEITHVLEGTELYSELQKAVLKYADAKGELATRKNALTHLYKGIKDANVDAELTADLVGDYLFTDADFIKNLSTEHRNVFQKIYDEVKYLIKVAKAGSKEARELEKVKRAFDKAYREGGKATTDTKYSLAMVERVQPKSKAWKPGANTDEVRAAHPTLYAVDEDATTERNPTQVKGTIGSYRKIYNVLQSEGFDGTILDASSGLGYGTRAGIEEYGFDVEDIEPYPDSGYKPKYTDYSHLNKKYDAIISNAVLNVLPQDQRDALVIKMGELLNDGGRMFVNVRGKDVMNASGKIAIDESNMEYFIPRTAKTGSYQKGFTKGELVAYLQDALGDGYSVQSTNMFGAVSAVVTKDGGVKYSLTAEQQEYFKDSVVRDENGDLKVMYHGTSKGGHTVFDTYGSNYGLFGRGSYFTDNKGVAETYTKKGKGNAPQVYEAYLNITNPMDMGAAADADAWRKSFPDASFPESGTNEDFYRAMEEYFQDEEYSKWEAAEAAMDGLMGMGYDGITHIGGGRVNADGVRHQVYIAFHPEQIKNIDNAKPTDNPDIRYSLSDSEGRQLSKEQGEYFKDSKMRDDNGALKVMYHGSQDAGFHEFDTLFSDDGTSFFFVDNPKVAKSYSGSDEVYTAQTLRTAEDFNRFFAEIGMEEYEVKEEMHGDYKWFVLYEDGAEVASSETAKMLYDEFRDWTGLGTGSANYQVYLNLTNPLEIDAKNSEWSDIPLSGELLKGINESWDNPDPYGYIHTATTRQISEYAKAQGYDGVIFKNILDNGAYASGADRYAPSTVAIAFESNQIKSVANSKPTGNADIRYSLSRNAELMQNAEDANSLGIDLSTARQQRQAIYEYMTKNAARLKLPEDIEGNTAIKNSSYDITEENTTVCIRSMAADALCDAVAEELGRPLTVEDTLRISQDLMNYTDEPECVYCYVATDRKAYREFLGSYYNQMQSAIKEIQSGKDSEAVYKAFLDGRKDTKNMRARFAMWERIAGGGKTITAKDLASEKMMQNAMRDPELAAQVKDARAYAQSASWAKKRMGYQAYDGHILDWSQRRISDLNKHYGLRFYSFSDFSPAFVLENMQQMTDAAVRGLKGLAYTKVLDFAEIFAPTNININISVFGYDQNGVVAQDGMMGADWKGAQDLRNRFENVGITFVATNDTQIEWALNQDWIDVVIPYHLVRTGKAVAEHFGYTNYTSESGDTKGAKWKKGDKKTIYPAEHNNDKQTYLAALAEANLEPRFARWVNHPNYMKLVNETRRSAKDTPPMQAKFNDGAAIASLDRMAKRGGYFVPIGGDYANMQEIAGDIANDIRKSNSLSAEGEQIAPIGNYNVYGRDVALQKPSVTEATAPVENAVDNTVDNTVADDFAPMPSEPTLYELQAEQKALEDEIRTAMEANDQENGVALIERYNELSEEIKRLEADETARTGSITDADAPPEVDAPYYGDNGSVVADNPFEGRDIKEVGKRSVKAYMYENPEVKPFFQEEAEIMLGELRDTTKGERYYTPVEGGVPGEYGSDSYGFWTGVSRHTTPDIAYLLDELNYSYAEIEKGLNAIIEDNGAENNACSKRIEFLLNDRLRNGYQAIDGFDVPANQEYIKLLEEKQITEYSKEAFDRFMANADAYAPQEDIAPVENEIAATKEPDAPAEDIAPVAAPAKPYASEAIKPKPVKEPRMARATAEEQLRMAEDIAPTYETTSEKQVPGQRRMFADGHTAEVLEGEPPVATKQSRIWSKFRNNFLDKQSVFEDLALKTHNRELMGKANYMLSSESRAQWMIGHGAQGVKSLNDIRSEVEKTGLTKQFSEYLYHVHNIDRMTLDVRFGTENKAVFGDSVTAEVSRAEVKKIEARYPQFKSYANDVYAYNKHLRQQMVKSGVISQETAALWDKMYPHYVPIRRVGESGLGVYVPLDSRKTGVNAPIKRATGGSSDILPLFDTMAMRTEQTYKAIAKNRFGVELKNTLGTTVETTKASLDEIIEGVDTHEELLQKGKNGANPTFTVFENGKRVKFEISEDMYDALRPTAEGLKTVIKPLSAASTIQRGILTEYNPVFMLTNAVKDAQDVLINSQHPAKTYAKLPAAFRELATKGAWYNEYMANGGEQNTYFDGQSNTFTKEDAGIKKIVGMPLRAISAVNNFFERAPRLAEYMASREAGASAEVAMLDAARVTTNFQAGGDVTKWANRNGFTFLNASVQGFNQQVRNVREAKANGLKGWAQLATKVALAGLPAMLLNNMLWDDDEEYEELSDYVKENYYVVAKYGDGKFVRIPKGRTMAVIQNAFEQVSKALTGDDEVDLNSFLELVVSNLAPNNPLDNNIIAPIMQVAENKTWYGEALVPQRLQDLPAAEQYDESTDEISKWLGEKLNVSPYKLNYLLNQYSGGVGDVVLPHFTPEAERGESSILAPFADKFTTDSVMNNQNVSDFYDTMDTLTANAKSMYATDEDVLKYKYFNTVNADLSELYQQKREIQNSNLSDATKYAQMRAIQEQINALAKNSLETYGNVNIDGSYASIGDEHFHLNDKGEWTKVTDKQFQKQEEVTGGFGISASDYWSNKEEYDYAYENPERYAVSQAVGSYDAWKTYSSALYDIKADKDEDGKSISGSRKEKVIAWINEQDMDYGAKLVLFKSEYPADDTYNAEIVEYLNSREDITYAQMVTILKELGFKVNGNNVTWD